MEVDFPEQDGSSTDEEDTVSSSVSEDGDSSGRKKKKKSGLKHQHTAKILKYTSESDVGPTQYVAVNENELTSWPSWVDTGWGGDAMMLMAVGESKELMSDLSLFTWCRDGRWGLWEEEDGVSGWDDHPGETVHWPEGAVSHTPTPVCPEWRLYCMLKVDFYLEMHLDAWHALSKSPHMSIICCRSIRNDGPCSEDSPGSPGCLVKGLFAGTVLYAAGYKVTCKSLVTSWIVRLRCDLPYQPCWR